MGPALLMAETRACLRTLIESHDDSPAVKAALDRASAWLVDRQRNSGAIRSSGTSRMRLTPSTSFDSCSSTLP